MDRGGFEQIGEIGFLKPLDGFPDVVGECFVVRGVGCGSWRLR